MTRKQFSSLRAFASLSTFVALAALGAACSTVQARAAKDPLKCERDPDCKNHSRQFDCSTQCADDPACVDRCNEIQQQTGTSAPH